jgi:hypothetical protein
MGSTVVDPVTEIVRGSAVVSLPTHPLTKAVATRRRIATPMKNTEDDRLLTDVVIIYFNGVENL